MTDSLVRCGMAAAAAILICTSSARAQQLEVTPLAGYRFGGDFFELLTGRSVDADGAPAFGVVIDIPIPEIQLEGLFTRQLADVITTDRFGVQTRRRVTVDHWQAGGLSELRGGSVRPFLTGLLGLTRFAIEGDDGEWRFVASGGGGVKLFPTRRVGVRLDGRVFATFVNFGSSRAVCGAGPCLVALDVDIVWQAEFTAGLVVAIR